MTPPLKPPPGLKRTAVVLGLLFLFDLGFSGQGLFSLLGPRVGFGDRRGLIPLLSLAQG